LSAIRLDDDPSAVIYVAAVLRAYPTTKLLTALRGGQLLTV